VIPCLDIKEGRVVKGVQFENITDAGDPVENAVFYDRAGADELVFLDITATHEERGILIKLVERIAENLTIPFTVGGGLRTLEDIIAITRAGADKVSLNSAAVKRPELITEGAKLFGSQCIVLAVDAKRVGSSWHVFVRGGREDTGLDVLTWIERGEKMGAGEILLTSMDRDGMKNGFDLELLQEVSKRVNIPVIASGGAGTAEHMADGIALGKADAVLAASIFHFRELSVAQVKQTMKDRGIWVRQ
jgi:cyclase